MANEIQRATADTLIANIEDGVIIFDFDGETTSAIAFGDLTSANIQAELEALSNIGSGNVAVADHNNGGGFLIGFTITFQGSLANLPQVDITINSSTLKADASGITVVAEATAGVADVASAVDNQIEVAKTTPVQEVHRIDFDLVPDDGILYFGATAVATISGIVTDPEYCTGIEATLEAAPFSLTDVTVTGGLASGFEITYSVADGNVSDTLIDTSSSTLTSSSTPVVITVSVFTSYVAGVHQADHCTVSPAPTAGAITYQGQSLDWNVNANTLTLTGGSAAGTPASGLIVFTWDSYDDETPVTVDAGTAVVAGAYQVATVTLDDSPDEGTLKITVNSVASDSFAYGADATAVNAALAVSSIPFTASGNTPAWTLTANAKAASLTVTAAEFDPLRRSVVVTMSEIQAGEAVASGGGFMLLCAG